MKKSIFPLLLLASLFCEKMVAQNNPPCDSIYFLDGRIMAAKVENMGRYEIIYSPCGDNSGSSFATKTENLQKIRYRTGKEQVFGAGSSSIKDNPAEPGIRRFALYVSPTPMAALNDELEPVVAFGLNLDGRFPASSKNRSLGFSATLSTASGLYSQYPDPFGFFKIGPKLFWGENRWKRSVEIQLLRFWYDEYMAGAGRYKKTGSTGVSAGIGLSITGKKGFYFHPKMNWLFAPNGPYDLTQFNIFEFQMGVGYAFL